MYEMIDARTFGHDIERPLIIAERWGHQLRRVYAFHPCDENYAREILNGLNSGLEPSDLTNVGAW